jgi:2-hydroxy-6-oxonona-2,4-dienedioate hydrolase
MALTEEDLLPVSGMSSRWVRLDSGAKAHYMTSGDHGPSVVLLHGGLPGSSGQAGWRFMAPFLGENGFRVYCPDMPAFGLSDPAPEQRPRDLGAHVDFIHEFVNAICLDRFHIAGNSMGCINSINYTVAHPDRVINYVLIAGFVGDITEDVARVPPPTPVPPFDGTVESMRAMMEMIILRPEGYGDDLLEMRVKAANRHADAYRVLADSIYKYGARIPWAPEDECQRIRLSTKGRFDVLSSIPGIYLYGVDDVISPVANGHAQEDRLPHIQFFYPEDCGHQGQTDQPELFNQVSLEFFRDGRVSRQTADRAGVSRRRPELINLVEPATT